MSIIYGHLFIVLSRVCIGTGLAGSLAWLVDYARHHGLRNVVGRTLLTKTAIITALLALSLLSSFFRPASRAEEALAWASLALVALIGPAMVWRLAVFRRVSAAVTCPDGHPAPVSARFCPECGQPVPQGPPAD